MAESYSGRLAFDPDTHFHVAEDGRPVVTEDGGKSWRYAEDGDPSHYDRYHQQFAQVDTTANQLGELQLEHGRVEAERLLREQQPHHFEVQPDDAHFAGVRADPDHVAETITGHTEAWRDE